MAEPLPAQRERLAAIAPPPPTGAARVLQAWLERDAEWLDRKGERR
jgi:hypothetical protein